jgi:hypothetical protein
MELYWEKELAFREEDMTTYQIDTTVGVTSTVPWNTITTTMYPYTYPYTLWTTVPHAQKCQNCGYCSCCGKSDIPGDLTPPDDGE